MIGLDGFLIPACLLEISRFFFHMPFTAVPSLGKLGCKRIIQEIEGSIAAARIYRYNIRAKEDANIIIIQRTWSNIRDHVVPTRVAQRSDNRASAKVESPRQNLYLQLTELANTP